MDELLTNGELAAGQLDLSPDNARLYAEYRRLAAEQAALRRLATLVARGAEPSEVFDAVVNEMRRCLVTEGAGLWRYEASDEITLLAAAHHPAAQVMRRPAGFRMTIDGSTLAAMVQRTGRPARVDSYENTAGRVAEFMRAVGVRAAVGVPVIVDGRVWGLATVSSAEPGPMPADTEARISAFAELIGIAVVAGYRDEQKRQMFDDTSRRPLLIDSLLEGRVVDDCSLSEIAGYLRLPKDGPFVIIAAEVTPGDSEPLPLIEPKLRSLDVYSAWRPLPDWQVGIVHLASEQQLDRVVALVSRTAVGRLGVSAQFNDLREAPQALHFAKVTLRGRPNASTVAVFDGTILATAALAAPEVMVKSAGITLACFSDLPDEEREILFETFRVWQETEASVGAAAERLCCHPNTVRYRLRRIEKRTGLTRRRHIRRSAGDAKCRPRGGLRLRRDRFRAERDRRSRVRNADCHIRTSQRRHAASLTAFVQPYRGTNMTDLVEHIRAILEHHHIDDQSNIADVGCSCGVANLADHYGHVAQQLVDRLELRREAVGSKTRYVSAWFDDELTKLEGAE